MTLARAGAGVKPTRPGHRRRRTRLHYRHEDAAAPGDAGGRIAS